MKRFLKLTCIILSLAICMAVPVSAQTEQNTRGSNYFHMISYYIYQLNETQFEVWFDVAAVERMLEIGSSEIVVQRSADGVNWVDMFTYLPQYYPQMIEYNTACYMNCIPYHGTLGYYYRAQVTFYAKNSRGTGKMFRTTETVYLQPSN